MKMKKTILIAVLCAQQAYAAHFDSNATLPEYTGSASGTSWSSPQPQTMFYCFGLDSKERPILNGVEFSFRDNDEKSQRGACGNLMVSSYKAISGKDLSISKDLDFQGDIQYLLGENDGYPFELVSFYSLPGNERLGWYRANSKSGFEALNKGMFSYHKHGFFSEGVFGQALEGFPKTGIAYYKGTASDPTRISGEPAQVKNVNVAKVDFAKGELTINIETTNVIGSRVAIYTTQPIAINKENGSFRGKVSVVTSISRTAIINGFVGGKNASVVYGLFSYGDAFSNEGIDFILGAKR